MFRIVAFLSAVFSISISFAQVDCLGFVGGTALPGTPCTDGNAFTTNDTWDAACNCVGVWTDCNGVLNGPDIPGASCDDGNPATQNDEWNWNCTCGTASLIDCLGVPNGTALPGTWCDDGDPNTGNDVWNAICQCEGTSIDCNGVAGGIALPGTPCDDGDPATLNDVWNADCSCGVNSLIDCNGVAGGTDLPGTPCDDGNALTVNDTWSPWCSCIGEPIDCLGVPFGSNLPWTICDDANPATVNDLWDMSCTCVGSANDCTGVPGGTAVFGTPCNDGDPYTYDDRWQIGCSCQGVVNRIRGYLIMDLNMDSVWSGVDYLLSNRLIEVTGSNGITQSIFTHAQGGFDFIVDTGVFTINVPVTGSDSMLITNQKTTFSSFDSIANIVVPMVYNSDVFDIGTYLYQAGAWSWPRPGFDNGISLQVKNFGNVEVPGNVVLEIDSSQTFVSATPPADSVVANTVYWTLDTISAGAILGYLVILNTDSTIALGTPVSHTSQLITMPLDTLISNNVDTLNQLVVGSYDPNDKRVAPSVLEPVQGALGIELQYRIRFQNTGTFYAENVRVEDMLPPELDASTFEFIESSHQCQWQNDNGNLTFYFNQIFLPDSNTNEPQSHGHILFNIDSYSGLNPGDSISNSASIFFDFNAPVITEPAITRVAIPSTISQAERDEELVVVWPNPANNQLNITFNTSVYSDANFVLYDIAGKQVAQHVLQAGRRNAQIALGNLESSIYYYTITAQDSIIEQGKLSVVR